MKKDRKEEIQEVTENIIEKNMADIMSDRFGRYSKYIIQQRAIPDARDGLKPVQRRILYSMWNLHLKNSEPFKKSARIVGDVIGRYHPHGDISIYEALVRMAQDWKSNFPLIEMHGNKGSIDDDPAAAMRYTESRLEKISELMLKDLDRKVVKMAPNFDDSEYEPIVLPALFPNLLVNGAKGIAAGFATEIPPHNLGEVIDATIALIKNPTISIEELSEIVKGPDFPTGAIINGINEIKKALSSGQGRITISSKYHYVYDKKDESKIIGIEIIEIPFGVVKSKLVADIDAIAIDKKISGIKEVLDQTDRNGISIFIQLEDGANADAIIAYLMNKTELSISYSYNMVAIDNNRPVILNLYSALIAYLSHLKEVNINGINYDLKKFKLRLEIVEGFIKVAEISDEVIHLIKESDNSKKGVILALMNKFKFSELQATAIAELRLYKLSRMDQIEFQEEKKNLEIQIENCNKLLNDKWEFNQYLIKQLLEIKNQYSKPRLTEISDQKIDKEIDHKLLTKNEDFYLYITKDGYYKKISLKVYTSNELSTFKLKEEDNVFYFDKVNSLSKILFFTNLGNYFIIDCHLFKDCNWKDLGQHISSIVALESSEKIIRVIEITSFNSYANFILISKLGYAKKVNLRDFENKSSLKTKTCMSFKDDNDELIDAQISNDEKMLFILLNNGMYHLVSENELKVGISLKARGIRLLLNLYKHPQLQVSGFITVSKYNNIIYLTQGGYIKCWDASKLELTTRNTPKMLFTPLKNNILGLQSLAVTLSNLKMLYTDNNGNLAEYDWKFILKDKTKESKLLKLDYSFTNPGYFITPIKINELIEADEIEQEKIRQEYQGYIDKNIELTAEHALIKKSYNQDIQHLNNEEQEELFQISTEDIELPNVSNNVNDNQKNKKNIATKESVSQKIQEIEKIDLETIMQKIKQIKKK